MPADRRKQRGHPELRIKPDHCWFHWTTKNFDPDAFKIARAEHAIYFSPSVVVAFLLEDSLLSWELKVTNAHGKNNHCERHEKERTLPRAGHSRRGHHHWFKLQRREGLIQTFGGQLANDNRRADQSWTLTSCLPSSACLLVTSGLSLVFSVFFSSAKFSARHNYSECELLVQLIIMKEKTPMKTIFK